MDHAERIEPADFLPGDAQPAPPTLEKQPRGASTPQSAGASCPSCGASQGASARSARSPVYVIGNIEPRFPARSVENEFKQATARAGSTANLTDRAAFLKVLQDPLNSYLVRMLCWVVVVQGVDTYILSPRYQQDFSLLVGAYRAQLAPGDIDVVVGTLGPVAGPSVCNGLQVPIVIFDQIYFSDRDQFFKSIPHPKATEEKKFIAAAQELFDRIVSRSGNAGATAADRALNYLLLRYSHVYTTVFNAFAINCSFTAVEVLPSPLGGGTRNIVDVVFSFTDRTTNVVSKQFVRVDVTDTFPFLVTGISPTFDLRA